MRSGDLGGHRRRAWSAAAGMDGNGLSTWRLSCRKGGHTKNLGEFPHQSAVPMLQAFPLFNSDFMKYIREMWSDFVLKWNEVKLRRSSWEQKYHVQYIRVTLHWGYLTVLWLFHLVCILYCGCFNFFCNVWVCVCGGEGVVCNVWFFWQLCGVFLVICVLVFTVFFYCFVYVYLFLFVTSVRTTATEWQLNCS
jgi:hypothetical protein